jgi:hypothetical protein
MSTGRDGIYSARITRPTLERLTVAELDEAARGVISFVATQPPRVGSRVQVEVAVGDTAASRQQGLVIWSRPARAGLVAGFRVQLENPPPALMKKLKPLVDSVREGTAARETTGPRRVSIDAPARERVSSSPGMPALKPPVQVELAVDTDFGQLEAIPAPRTCRNLRVRWLFRPNPPLSLPVPLLLLPPPPLPTHEAEEAGGASPESAF